MLGIQCFGLALTNLHYRVLSFGQWSMMSFISASDVSHLVKLLGGSKSFLSTLPTSTPLISSVEFVRPSEPSESMRNGHAGTSWAIQTVALRDSQVLQTSIGRSAANLIVYFVQACPSILPFATSTFSAPGRSFISPNSFSGIEVWR